jgi:RNA polymerase sigma factor for flagellar operon FliA
MKNNDEMEEERQIATAAAVCVTAIVALRAPISRKARSSGAEATESGRPVARFSGAAREKLILDHLPLVKHILSRVAAHLPSHVDREDLLEAGTLGLIHAVDHFNPGRNVRFPTYALTRIRGAMLDALRSADWLPRSVRSELRRIARISAKLKQEVNRPPTSAEICERTGLAARDLAELEFAGANAFFSLDALPLAGGFSGEYAAAQHQRRDSSLQPLACAALEEEKSRLAGAILRLSRIERLVIKRYYFERLKLHEIGAILHVTASRACQIHRAALKRLAGDLTSNADYGATAVGGQENLAAFAERSKEGETRMNKLDSGHRVA